MGKMDFGIVKIKRIWQNYHVGMAAYDHCHSPTVTSTLVAFKSEVLEFTENPSTQEAWDILHSGGRLFWKLTGIPLHLMAWPTVCKHSVRYANYGCIRSSRNCEGKCCSL
ncbi:MAG: hypothetical protein SAK29_17155 [Scytonema sp. PMC 1069.18]|nr:hypothetical protein [Scytonema sp. PMC 1069.18]MEC4883733.1 hypothetical protein [Scytonema sp. PMC 1070.18]